MRIKIIIFQFLGELFFVKGFDVIPYLMLDNASLEVFRSQSSFSFYSDPTTISHYLVLISAFGLLGLLFACAISYYINKKKDYKQILLFASFILTLLLNKLFVGLIEIINFKSKYFEHYSVKSLLTLSLFITILIGFLILLIPKHLEKLNYYLKFHT